MKCPVCGVRLVKSGDGLYCENCGEPYFKCDGCGKYITNDDLDKVHDLCQECCL